ncbi:PAS domain S-box protein [Geotalea sp. SG265]|uniref:PAS domain S-box protein n=1 Tax=Geotalea sp. SG265 TaxID=2922867 RepID=UPI001FAFC064|nr:PAS domain S-box protein [Geotalea sp. SG265]
MPKISQWEKCILLAALVWTVALMASYYWNVYCETYAAPFSNHAQFQLRWVAIGHFLLWSAAMAGLFYGARRFRRSEKKRLKAEEDLKQSLELSGIVLEATQDAICIVNVNDYSIQSANGVFLRQTGRTLDQVIGKTCHAVTHSLCHPCGTASCPIRMAMETGACQTMEHLHVGKQGETLYEEVTAYPIQDKDGAINRILHVARDVTARKGVEESLRQSQEKYRAIFENTGAATIIVEADGTIVMANREFEQLSGYFSDELEGKRPWQQFVAEKDRELVLKKHSQKEIDGNHSIDSYEFRFTGAAGTIRDVVVRWGEIPGTNKLVGSFLDITDQKRVEEALRSSESLLALAQKISHLGSWDWDVVSNTITWSDEMYRIWGVDRDSFSVTYESTFSMVHPEDRERVNRAMNEALYANKLFNMDYRLILSDGRVRTVAVQGEVAFDEGGKPIRMDGTTQDITWRQEAEDALRRSEEKFAKAFHASPDWIVISRAGDGKYIEVNEAFLDITGYSREEVIGKTSTELGIWFDPRDRMLMLKCLNENSLVRNLEVSFRIKSGELRIMLWSAEVIEYGGEACLIAIARDVTEQRVLEKELRKSQSQLYMKHEELKNLFLQMENIRREWEQTLDFISDIFILVDNGGRIKRFNRALENFTTVSHRDIVGRDWKQFLAAHGLQQNVLQPGVEIYNGASGKWLVLNFRPYDEGAVSGDMGGVVTINDVTAIKTAAIGYSTV